MFLLAAVIYCVVIFGPPILDNMRVMGAIRELHSIAGVKVDHQVRQDIKEKLRLVGSHLEDDGFGNLQEVPGLGITEDHVTVERDTVRNRILIRVDYERSLRLWPSSHEVTMKFSPEREGEFK